MEEYELNVIIQAAALMPERAYIVEGAKPRSRLLRKFIHEQEHMTEEDLSQASSYTWTCPIQHPNFAVSQALLDKGLCMVVDTMLGEIVLLYDGFRFSTIHQHWQILGQKACLNGVEREEFEVEIL